MSIGRPMFSAEQSTCPKCGAVQQSPGSTVCEVCGADLMLPQATASSPQQSNPPVSERLQKTSLRMPSLRLPKFRLPSFRLPKFRLPSLRAPSVRAPSLKAPARAMVSAPATMLRRMVAAVRWTLSFILQVVWRLVLVTLKGAAVILVTAALIIGLSYIPQVRAWVPAMKDVSALTQEWLPRAQELVRPILARVGIRIQPASRRTSRPAASTQNPSAAKPAAAKPATTQTAVVSVMVRSTPSEATVLLNTRRAGKTPMTLRVRPGTYKVTINRPGYLSATRTIVVKAGQPVTLNVTLTAAP